MNEKQTAYAIRRELDQGAAALAAQVTQRLHQARTASLQHMAERPTTRRATDPDQPSRLTRFVVTAVPVMVVTIGLFSISEWTDGRHTEQIAHELAALDEAVLLDELPIAAYTDKGFGVFLENTRQ